MNHYNLITFTSASQRGETWENGEHEKLRACRTEGGGALGGEEARTFYESLPMTVGEAGMSLTHSCNERRRRQPRSRPASEHSNPVPVSPAAAQRNGHLMLMSAQNGDLKTLRGLVEGARCDLNFHDSFYWTAMMCAAYAGQLEVVRYLLKCGAAWVGVCNATGQDALELAQQAGHAEIISALEEFNRQRQEREHRERPKVKKFCLVCEVEYKEASVSEHERSTLHLFNTRNPPAPTYYFIPETNRGFKMMLRGGWDREKGLGPDGSGQKFPVKTVLKRDQRGLGFQSDLKAKVTHFDAGDEGAVKGPEGMPVRVKRAATMSRREQRRKEAKERAWERDLRTYMNL
uniref:G patch domain and ankyrin repeats 1 n=1 Tax=Callorhinchus milii TaxID=7868 RepID=V9KYI1_CALMI